MTEQESKLNDLNGRPLGARAIKKRRQLMDATIELLKTTSLRDLKVVDIARAVETSPATFYQYFKDVEDVVLLLAEEATEQMPSLIGMIADDREGEAGLEAARRVVNAFIEYWDEHGPVLRVRNIAADEGDIRFLEVRSRATTPLLESMVSRMEQRPDADTFKPMAAAVAMGAILDRLSAYHLELEGLGVSREDLVQTSARILYETLTGQKVSG
jgi:AcrR family transcriptional regulator